MMSSTDSTVTSESADNWTSSTSTRSDQSILEELAWRSFHRVIPVVIFCALLSILGTIGNSLSVYIFMVRMRRNFLNDLFILLSGSSLLACAVCLPGEIFDLYYPYIYPSAAFCKIGRFLNLMTTTCLVSTLWTLAVYRLIAAQASSSQSLTVRRRLTFVTAILIWSLAFSLQGINVYGMKTIHVRISTSLDDNNNDNSGDTLTGRDCAIGSDVEDTVWPMVYNLSMIAGFLTLVTTTVVCYYRIWRLVVRSRMAVAAHVRPSLAEHGGTVSETETTTNLGPSQNHDRPDSIEDSEEGASYNNYHASERLHAGTMVGAVDSESNMRIQGKGIGQETITYSESESYRHLQRGVITGETGLGGSSEVPEVEDSKKSPTPPLEPGLNNSSNEEVHRDLYLPVTHQGRSDTSDPPFDFDGTTDDSLIILQENKNIEGQGMQKNYVSFPTVSPKPLNSERSSRYGAHATGMPTTMPDLFDRQQHQVRPVNVNVKTPVELFTVVPSSQPPQKPSFKVDNNKKKAFTNHLVQKKASVNSRKAPKSSLESNITKTALLLAVTFILCYVPFFSVSIPNLLYPNMSYGLNSLSLNLLTLAYRLYFITPAINPLIFYASNVDFRKKLKELLRTVKRQLG